MQNKKAMKYLRNGFWSSKGIPWEMEVLGDHEVYGLIGLDMQISSMGMLDYYSGLIHRTIQI